MDQDFTYIGGFEAAAFSHPFSSGHTKSNPCDTTVGNLVTQALGDRTARASGPSAAACGMRTHEPAPLKDHPWYEHCKHPLSSILPSFKIQFLNRIGQSPPPKLAEP